MPLKPLALVIGVAGSGNAVDLLRCGADVAVADAADICVRVEDRRVTSESRPQRSLRHPGGSLTIARNESQSSHTRCKD
jgi:hypothetical protein